jgi:3-phenylpropionate/cinnamic acid dioxygenase small subunit
MEEGTMPLAIEDVLAVHALYARYDQLFDDQDRAGWVALFTQDTVRRVLAPNGEGDAEEVGFWQGRAALEELWQTRQGQYQDEIVRHFSSDVVVDGDGDVARGQVKSMVVCYRDGLPYLMNTGRIMDELVKEDGRWRFKSRTIWPDGMGGVGGGVQPNHGTFDLEFAAGALRDEAEIRRLLITLSDAGDRYDAERAISCFHPDAIDEHGHLYQGLASDFIRWGMDPNRSGAATRIQHALSNMRIEVHGDVAASQTYVLATHVKTEADGETYIVWFGGRYLDRLERREGQWKIAYRRVIMDWDLRVPYQPAYPPDLWPTGSRSRDDESVAFFERVAKGLPWPENPYSPAVTGA